MARDVASIKHFGNFARLNFPQLLGEYLDMQEIRTDQSIDTEQLRKIMD